MAAITNSRVRIILAGTALTALASCGEPLRFNTLDFDLRGGGSDTTDAVRQATTSRPQPDSRGVISYPNYQVVVARRGDTVADIANRVGLPAADLARHNGLPIGEVLRKDEVLSLPSRVAEPSPATGSAQTGPIQPAEQINVTTLAGSAIDRAEAGTTATPATPARVQTGSEPIRHKVARGETAYSVARLYDVSVRSLTEWNGLGPDLAIREGQFLLIPTAAGAPPRNAVAVTTEPGTGSPTPEPPSAAKPLPAEQAAPGKPADTPASPALAADRSSKSRLQVPVPGNIIRAYQKQKNDGIDIAAAAGTPVKAAADGTVAAITTDTDQVPILVIRHANNLLTVYAGVDAISVKKGDTVKRGQTIAKVRSGTPSFLHFEVRDGFESTDPVPYIN